MTSRLLLLGLGVDPIEHATLEVLEAAQTCDVLFTQGLEPAAVDYLRRFHQDVRALPRPPAQDAAAAALIMERLGSSGTVGVCTPLHPFQFSGLAAALVSACAQKGVPWETFAAVSALGLALSVMGRTLGEDTYGLQAFELSALGGPGAVLNEALLCVLYFNAAVSAEDLRRAAGVLGTRYLPSHRVTVCGARGIEAQTSLSELAGLAGRVGPGNILFLDPAIKDAEAWDRLFKPRGRSQSDMAADHKRSPAWVEE